MSKISWMCQLHLKWNWKLPSATTYKKFQSLMNNYEWHKRDVLKRSERRKHYFQHSWKDILYSCLDFQSLIMETKVESHFLRDGIWHCLDSEWYGMHYIKVRVWLRERENCSIWKVWEDSQSYFSDRSPQLFGLKDSSSNKCIEIF